MMQESICGHGNTYQCECGQTNELPEFRTWGEETWAVAGGGIVGGTYVPPPVCTAVEAKVF